MRRRAVPALLLGAVLAAALLSGRIALGGERVGIFSEALPGADAGLPSRLASGLRDALGLEVELLDGAAVCDERAIAALSLLVIPGAHTYPAGGFTALSAYLKAGGKLMLLGGPPFQNPVWRHRGRWIDRAIVSAELHAVAAAHVVLDFEDEAALSAWTRMTSDPSLPARFACEAGGPGGKGRCLAVSMEKLTGWFTIGSPRLRRMFPEGHELLCFSAHGEARTRELAIELNEEDGSRWIAVIALESVWKR